MMHVRSRIDHLVLVAASLEQGAEYCGLRLGVRPSAGGRHAAMGTHNNLLRLGDDIYLEVIAIDPDAPAPRRPRWFGMDESSCRTRAANSPFLATFVAATPQIETLAALVPELGNVEEMRRDALRWRITVRGDGRLVDEGCVPPAIEWPDNAHPATRMHDYGCSLAKLEVHPPAGSHVKERWLAAGLSDPRICLLAGTEDGPRLRAHIVTPTGLKYLD